MTALKHEKAELLYGNGWYSYTTELLLFQKYEKKWFPPYAHKTLDDDPERQTPRWTPAQQKALDAYHKSLETSLPEDISVASDAFYEANWETGGDILRIRAVHRAQELAGIRPVAQQADDPENLDDFTDALADVAERG